MDHPLDSSTGQHEQFSLPLFAFTVSVTLGGLFALIWLVSPSVWSQQLTATLWKGAVVFGVITFVNCFVEYFFHRYVLHTPAIPFLRRFYRQHTHHHALTRIVRKAGIGGREVFFIENKFPIVEPEQGEASFFPWYSLLVFALLLTPLLALLQWLVPSFPWFLAGFLALASSLTLYEILHAIEHWPFERWSPLIDHPRWGRLWRAIYGFHLRHHAVIHCNESISGFFGLPIADWTFGTCVIPKTIFANGEQATDVKFASPKPRALIRLLDLWAAKAVHLHRSRAAKGVDRC